MTDLDAVVVGAGPNGLAAALTLAEAGHSVRIYEASSTPGGGCRTAELTQPGYLHDVCSTVQALTQVSPFFRGLDLDALGVRIRQPEIPYAQPLDHGQAAVAYRDIEQTAAGLGVDGPAWRRLLGTLTEHSDDLFADIFSDLRSVPGHPVTMARFGTAGVLPAATLAQRMFRTEPARALFAGVAAHAVRGLHAPLTSAYGMVLAITAHAVGWPVIEGGSGRLVDALVARLIELGVEIECDHPVTSLADLPASRVQLLDVTPRQLLDIAGEQVGGGYRRALQRFKYGPGVFKVDYALTEPVPWTNPDCHRAGTLHLGGTMAEVAASEAEMIAGQHSEKPYVLVVQASVADETRAPSGAGTLWAYCHVPSGSSLDQTHAIEGQLERFAPGFRDVVAARATRSAAEYESYDANYVGGDINGGRAGLFQTLLGPVPRWSRYRTAVPGVYLCSSSTPPGGGVHGMCGMNAAREVLRRELRSHGARVGSRD